MSTSKLIDIKMTRIKNKSEYTCANSYLCNMLMVSEAPSLNIQQLVISPPSQQCVRIPQSVGVALSLQWAQPPVSH